MAAGAEEQPSQRSSQPALRTSSRTEREAAATERRAAGRMKGVRKSTQQARSVALCRVSPRKALKRGREVEKIMTTPRVLGDVPATVQHTGRPQDTQGG